MNSLKISFITVIFSFTAVFMPFAAIADHNEAHTIQQLQEQVAALQSAIIAILNAAASRPEDPTSKAQAPIEVAQPSPGTGTPAIPAQPSPVVPATTPQTTPASSAGAAQPATPAQPAIPAPSTLVRPADGSRTSSGQATPAQPATPAVPAVSDKPSAIPQTASQRESAFQKIQEQLNSVQGKVNELRVQTPAPKPIPAAEFKPAPIAVSFPPSTVAPTLELTKPIKRGSSGEDVRQLQGFLSRFPDIYPTGTANGNFGPATEKAVKKLQEKFGIETTGTVGPKTRAKLSELSHAIGKKKAPRITEISPVSGNEGITITIRGRGFTETDNAIFVRGKTIVKGLKSEDGGALLNFILPRDIPCVVGSNQACPIKVINENGISNAKPFKLLEIPQAPEPEPTVTPPPSPAPTPTENTSSLCSDKIDNDGDGLVDLSDPNCFSFIPASPPPPPPPPPPPAPVILSLNPVKGPVGTAVAIKGSGFTSTGNMVKFSSATISSLSSPDGATLNFTVPANSGCAVGHTCSVSVTNVNGTSNTASFLLTQAVSPVTVLAPNGGEIFVQGVSNAIKWSGGTNKTQVLLVNDTAVSNSDPTDFIVGWIATSTVPSGTIIWNGRTVCTLEGVCSKVAPGSYKILVLSEDELGILMLWDDIFSKAGNWDVSDQPFKIYPEASLSLYIPNGGEYYTQGREMIICFEALGITGKTVTIQLLKNGVVYRVIAENYALDVETGSFAMRWTIPSDVEPGNDYTVKIFDSSLPQIYDISDRSFIIAKALSYLRVYAPNGGEYWVQGFKGSVSWYSSNLPSKAVNINLLKGGVFFKTVAVNLPQMYSWSSQPEANGSFATDTPITLDIPLGDDYQIEVTDAASSTIRDVSDAYFKVVALPETVTTRIRVLDYHTGNPFANQTSSVWDGVSSRYVTTNSNGELSLVATTSNIIKSGYFNFSIRPTCFESKSFSIYKDQYGLYTHVSIFPFIGPSRYYRIYSGDNNVGDTPFWQMTNLDIASELPAKAGLYYRDATSGKALQYGWPSQFRTLTTYYNAMPSMLDVWSRLEDIKGGAVYSAYETIPAGSCPAGKVLSYFDSTPRWEPYRLTVSPPWIYATEGQAVKSIGSVSGGTTPYNWNVSFGQLPPELALSSTGALSGTTTKPGFFDTTYRVTDTKGVINVNNRLTTIRNKDGTTPPIIRISWPTTRDQIAQGATFYVSGNVYNIASKLVNIELWKGGTFYRLIKSNFALSLPTTYATYQWQMPLDVPEGTDYAIRIYDSTNPLVFGMSEPFWVVSRVGAYWQKSSSFVGNRYSQYLYFHYATSSLPALEGFRLYEKRPQDADFKLAASFLDPSLCLAFKGGLISGPWTLRFNCTTAFDIWTISKTFAPLSEYPVGTYEYNVTAVNHDGTEKTIARLKQYALDRVSVLSPLVSESPLSDKTPIIRWTVPANWPAGVDKYFNIALRDASNGWYVKNIRALTPPHDLAGYVEYESPPDLDPAKKYSLEIDASFGFFDSNLLSSVNYMAMSLATSTFWISP